MRQSGEEKYVFEDLFVILTGMVCSTIFSGLKRDGCGMEPYVHMLLTSLKCSGHCIVGRQRIDGGLFRDR